MTARLRRVSCCLSRAVLSQLRPARTPSVPALRSRHWSSSRPFSATQGSLLASMKRTAHSAFGHPGEAAAAAAEEVAETKAAEAAQDDAMPVDEAAPAAAAAVAASAEAAPTSGFTTEFFKIDIRNLPRKCSVRDIKNLLASAGHDASKVKYQNGWGHAYVTFRDVALRDKAIEWVKTQTFRGSELTAVIAEARIDTRENRKRVRLDPSVPVAEHLADKVTPMWRTPYETQLKQKNRRMRRALGRIGKMCSKQPQPPPWLNEAMKEHQGIPCEMNDILASPVVEGYRNKVELTIGIGTDKLPTVGFNFASYADGVAEVDTVLVVSERTKQLAKAFQEFVRQSTFAVYEPVEHTGQLKSLMVRAPRAGGALVMFEFRANDVSAEDLERFSAELKAFMEPRIAAGLPLTSLVVSEVINRKGERPPPPNNRLLLGSDTIVEEMMGLKFRISPEAFFQVNTAGAEVLFGHVKEWCQLTAENAVNTILLDICCGTGIIGQSLAAVSREVAGFEICPEAVEDAKANAQLNGIENVKYFVGKAEETMPLYEQTYLRKQGDANVVGIVDPPRAGLHQKVITAIRKCKNLRRLVYVSCSISAASQNIVDLMRPVSKRHTGEPFRLVRAQPVDMFPHTEHCELVLLLER